MALEAPRRLVIRLQVWLRTLAHHIARLEDTFLEFFFCQEGCKKGLASAGFSEDADFEVALGQFRH